MNKLNIKNKYKIILAISLIIIYLLRNIFRSIYFKYKNNIKIISFIL